ncbi:MAG: SprT family zinc-dependent metalloprotease [Pseudomonadota bacterium]
MAEMVLPGDPAVAVVVRTSSRARRLSLRVSRLDGRVTLTMPSHIPVETARAFAYERADWVKRQLRDVAGPVAVGDGTLLPLEGVPTRVVLGRAAAPGEIAAKTAPALAGILKACARDRLADAVDHYTGLLGRKSTALTLRDTRSRWGSCSSRGRLMFSWRLIMAPPDVLDYVAAHEVAHLRHMDHSHAFWGTVEGLMPDYADHRDWLRAHGTDLHRYSFDH